PASPDCAARARRSRARDQVLTRCFVQRTRVPLTQAEPAEGGGPPLNPMSFPEETCRVIGDPRVVPNSGARNETRSVPGRGPNVLGRRRRGAALLLLLLLLLERGSRRARRGGGSGRRCRRLRRLVPRRGLRGLAGARRGW